MLSKSSLVNPVRNFNISKHSTISQWALEILQCTNPIEKAQKAQNAFSWLRTQTSYDSQMALTNEMFNSKHEPPLASRAEKPVLVQAKNMPSAKTLGVSMGVYLLHGLVHIELSAIDAVWDTILRFGGKEIMPFEYYVDMTLIANDESRHFTLLLERLRAIGSDYGALPAHENIFNSVEKTLHDFKGRIALIQLVHESRALDSGERLAKKFSSLNDHQSQKLIKVICEEEVGHVKIGIKWFVHLCNKQGLDPIETFRAYMKLYNIYTPPPFNKDARLSAGMGEEWYLPDLKTER